VKGYVDANTVLDTALGARARAQWCRAPAQALPITSLWSVLPAVRDKVAPALLGSYTAAKKDGLKFLSLRAVMRALCVLCRV
jgi:hypothetical protein